MPASTRQLRVLLVGQRPVSGGAIYGYADNVSVALTDGSCEPVLTVRCTGKAVVAEVTPSSVAKTRRVGFAVRDGARTRQVTDTRAPFAGRFTTSGGSGALTVAATVQQAGSGPITLTKRSQRC